MLSMSDYIVHLYYSLWNRRVAVVLSMCDYIVHLYYSLWSRRVVVSSMCDYIVHVYYSLWNRRVAVVLSMCDYIVHLYYSLWSRRVGVSCYNVSSLYTTSRSSSLNSTEATTAQWCKVMRWSYTTSKCFSIIYQT